MPIRQEDQTLWIESDRFCARFDGAHLASFADRRTGLEFCRPEPVDYPLELNYANRHALAKDKGEKVTVRLLSPQAARVIITGNDSDRELFIRLDAATGDLCVTPAGQSARRGLTSVRWMIPVDPQAELLLPCVNGIRVRTDQAFPGNDRFAWPFRWNAQMAIARREGCCMMIHAEDVAAKFKALELRRRQDGSSSLGLESEQVGPQWDNRTAGGVEWRLNTYEGDWQVPAGRFRQWMEHAYGLAEKRRGRPDWPDGVAFSLQWASPVPEVLDAAAALFPPQRTLIHLSNWRTSRYDVDYPDYVPTPQTRVYMDKARAMGFHVMPHFNYWACYDRHPLFAELRDWQVRDPYSNEPQGWYWPRETHERTRLAYIHPGLAKWRRILIDSVLAACRELQAPCAFLDQTLCAWNTDNGLVENMTTTEGMWRLQEQLWAIEPGLMLAGECLSEISFQRECFGQAHIHGGWSELLPYHPQAVCDLNAFLWRGHAKFVGYHQIAVGRPGTMLGLEVYRNMGVVPSLVCNDPALLVKDRPEVKMALELAEAFTA
jgi:hypothetical protein